MSEFYPDLPDRLKMSFSEIDSDIVVDLRKTDAEYVALYRELAEIKQQHPFIDTILEGEGGDQALRRGTRSSCPGCATDTETGEHGTSSHLFPRTHRRLCLSERDRGIIIDRSIICISFR